MVTGIARKLAAAPVALTLQRGAGRPASAPTRGSGAWLGTVPDFAPVDTGVLLGGVTADSPGDVAGMKKGDILIRIGDYEIADLQGFTDALSAYKPGDTVDILVLRGGSEVRLRVTLGRRGG
jgi:S1-C subfamily serine protease